MAVWLLTDKPRKKPWRAKVKGKVKDFVTKEDAEHWEREMLRSYTLTGLPLPMTDLKGTVADLVRRYMRDGGNGRKLHPQEISILEETLNKEPGKTLVSYPLAAIKKEHTYTYRLERSKQINQYGTPMKHSSIKRAISLLHAMWNIAREEWGMTTLSADNPFKIKWRGLLGGSKRTRRVSDEELSALIDACGRSYKHNRYYYPLAIALAVETGMRLQEIFNLTWNDIDLEKRRIKIRKSKTDKKQVAAGREIGMTLNAQFYFTCVLQGIPLDILGPTINRKHISSKDQRVFHVMTQDAFEQGWAKVRDRAGIKDLHFHDLRHEAASRFDQAGLTAPERNLMLGHSDGSTGSIYVHAELSIILRKLDAYHAAKAGPEVREFYQQRKQTMRAAG